MEAPPTSPPVWSQNAILLIKNLGTSQKSGLSEQQIKEATLRFGKNVLKAEKTVSHFTLILRQFKKSGDVNENIIL